MQFSVEIISGKELAKHFKKFGADVSADLKKEVVSTAFAIASGAKKEIQQGTKTGRLYIKKRSEKTGRPYRIYIDEGTENVPEGRLSRASAKGEAPATDTGTLVNSIKALPKAGINAEVQVNANYAGFLEEDLDRPYIAPQVEKAVPILDKKIDVILNKRIDEI